MQNQKNNLLDDTEKYVIFIEAFKFKHHHDNKYVRNGKSISYGITHDNWYFIEFFDYKTNKHGRTGYSTVDWMSKHLKDVFPKEYLVYKRRVKIKSLLRGSTQDMAL